MRAVQQVLHRSARAISVAEFHDALLATCKPRFPEARGQLYRHVALAVSGGVDSMALAYLCSQMRRYDPEIKITDNPCAGFRAFVVNHLLREGSTEEADTVAKALRRLGLPCDILPINWKKELGKDVDAKDLTNIESAARRVRYRRLGRQCALRRMATLLLAHHQDDQYETVLMRLLSGHRNRALCGMRKAADIPECEGVFGAYNSGWVDDQNRQYPFYDTKPTKKERKYLRQEIRSSISQLMLEEDPAEQFLADLDEFDDLDYDDWPAKKPMKYAMPTELKTIPIEDGGVSIYRPLLEFSKDRLIATCLENNIPWWEDHTNDDPTLTLRNSIRHMYKSCELPRALQKPSVLALSETWQRRAQAQDAEADRLLQRMVLHDFEPHIGSVVVQFPDVPVLGSKAYPTSKERYERRISQKRIIAGLVIQRIIAMISSEIQAPSISNLQNAIPQLFPSLAEPHNNPGVSHAKAFAIAGLHFMPIASTPHSVTSSVPTHPRTWYVSRQPYTTTLPLPSWRVPYWSSDTGETQAHRDARWKWSSWLPWHFWDGRFWIRLTHRLPYRVIIMPFLVEHAKDFRESLGPEDRGRLAAALKKYAPGKVRYTLPAIYTEEYLDLDNVVARPGYPVPEGLSEPDDHAGSRRRPAARRIDPSKMRLMALPTLDIQLPGLNQWLFHEVRYKKVERRTLQTVGSFTRGSFASSNRLKRRGVNATKQHRPGRVQFQEPTIRN
ncbi:hypothetical protein BJ170DRAFT_574221 [Xylariales sp. AK1849]|nr:hypothetical protein BJ170DRAFT_574221 [Xylariales sp. AK1849]